MTEIVVVSANDNVSGNENNSHTVAAELMDISTPLDKDLTVLDQVSRLQNSAEPHTENVILQNNMTQLQPQQTIVLGTSPITSQTVSTLTLSQLQSQLAQGSQILSIPASGDSSSRSVIKRQLGTSNSSATGPVVTKVIIAKNFSTSQPQAMPLQLNQLQTQAVSLTSVPSGLNLISQLQQGAQTPTKTVTISSQGIILSPQKQVPSSPSKPVQLTKIPSSPAKTPTKIAMIPVSMSKSPQKFIPVSGTSLLSKTDLSGQLLTNSNPQPVIMSPKKVIIKQEPGMKQAQSITQMLVTNQPNLATASSPQTLIPGNVQQIQVPGSKFHYVRLVTTTTQSPTVAQPSMAGTSLVQTRPIAPATATLSSVPIQSAGSQIKVNVPVQGTQMVMAKAQGQLNSQMTTQRILLPAPNQMSVQTSTTNSTLAQIRPAVSNTNVSVPLQTILQATSGNIQGLQGGFALVPASYVPQAQTSTKPQVSVVQQPTVIQQQQQPQPVQQPVIQQQQQQPQLQQQQQQQLELTKQLSDFIPIASKDSHLSADTVSRTNNVNGTPLETAGARPRKPCNCTKSQCLKLYCDCFANGEFCHNCNCMNCANNLLHEEERSRAIKSCLDRNPLAFHPKIGRSHAAKGSSEESRRHNKGCNCKRSGCLKNYCECYEAKIMCSNICKCIGCKNFEESPERKTLMHLADAAEVRVQQQTAAKTKLSSQISSLPSRTLQSASSGERLPYSFITAEVAEATCACLLAQAEEADRLKMPPVVQERMVIEEFGRCLMQIIESAKQTKAPSPPP